MDDRIDEILARLDALERRLDRLEGEAGGDAPRCSFLEEERRIVDTIVRLTTESILREVDARMADRPPRPPRDHHGPPPPHPHGPPGRRRR